MIFLGLIGIGGVIYRNSNVWKNGIIWYFLNKIEYLGVWFAEIEF